MDILEKAFQLISKYTLCDHCLGRQFAQLGYSMENNVRGSALKISLILQANEFACREDERGIQWLEVLASNGLSREGKETLSHLTGHLPKKTLHCFLCGD